MVDLGRVDVCLEVIIFSSRVNLPREDYLNHLCCMLAYLEKNHDA